MRFTEVVFLLCLLFITHGFAVRTQCSLDRTYRVLGASSSPVNCIKRGN